MKTTAVDMELTQLRTEKDAAGKAKIVGYAAVFNRDSKPIKIPNSNKTYIERILPGAFKDELAKPDLNVRATVLHDQKVILGRFEKGTVSLSEDQNGLRAEITPADTQAGRDAVVQVERGDLDRMSFGFERGIGEFEKRADGTVVHTIQKIEGFKEITLADNRAIYPDTSVHLRMAAEAIDRLEKPADDQKRAIVEVEDKSLKWCCDCLKSNLLSAASSIDSVMSACERMTEADATLTPEDQRAIDDAYNALRDMRRRIGPGLAALDAVGADDAAEPADEAAAEAADEAVVDAAAEARAISALATNGFARGEQLRVLARRITKRFASPAAAAAATSPAPATK
jgi:HK97 family phage prohead protease